MLPSVEQMPGRPFGPVEVKLPDESIWVFRLVRIACNVAGPKGTDANQLGELMLNWFGPDAGMPGTGFKVVFHHSVEGWSITLEAASSGGKRTPTALREQIQGNVLQLIQSPAMAERFTRFVPVYTLEAAAGLWGPETEPAQAGWTDVSRFNPRRGMFVARVRGRSMETKIPDGSWCLFRKCPPGSREGKIVLVQFNAMGDVETGGRYTVKKYHSEKAVTEDSWTHQRIQLLPLNPEFKPIEVEPPEAEQMVVVGEFIGVP
jgi:SOS-response transcriptional repressor LexA